MSLTILSVAYPLACVEPSAAGGAEQVLGWLDAEWVARGHRSLVVAQAGSKIADQLFATEIPHGPLTSETRLVATDRHQASLDRALTSTPVDLIHFHGIDFFRYRIPPTIPVLVTLHLPPAWYPAEIWHGPSNVHLQVVSETQRGACPQSLRGALSVIQNAVPPVPSEVTPEKGDYALILSRICPEKNVHTAMRAARRAGVPLLLAGATFPYPEHMAYFQDEVRPRLGMDARLMGSVGGAVKADLLARARCVLLPSLAPETSSLVAMEAAAAGTPVIAFRSGALPEIVEQGRTGFLVDGEAEMADAILRTCEIDSAVCRAVAARRFAFARMADEYEALYTKLLQTHPARRDTTRRCETSSARERVLQAEERACPS